MTPTGVQIGRRTGLMVTGACAVSASVEKKFEKGFDIPADASYFTFQLIN
jgi:hypothetical protein